nr:PREDICTED: solute carrier family 22 member 13-like isoform X2 [Latimeria chalumnae]|eukprot:XP_014350852.1 PREDICTED: solute carrier family 22 member 13-like isoform X2 [Latimeria chalumnae]
MSIASELFFFKFHLGIPSLVMALALIGKFFIQTTVFVSLLYGIELFPTLIRQKCVGFVGLWYRIGSILTASLSPEIGLGSMICYGCAPILGALLCLLLPETSNIPLPDTVEDCQRQPGLFGGFRSRYYFGDVFEILLVLTITQSHYF